MQGEVRETLARGIGAGWRGLVGAELGGGSSSSWLRTSARKEKGEAKLETEPE